MDKTLLEQIKKEVAQSIVKREWTDIHDVLQEEYYKSWEELEFDQIVDSEMIEKVCDKYAELQARAFADFMLSKGNRIACGEKDWEDFINAK